MICPSALSIKSVQMPHKTGLLEADFFEPMYTRKRRMKRHQSFQPLMRRPPLIDIFRIAGIPAKTRLLMMKTSEQERRKMPPGNAKSAVSCRRKETFMHSGKKRNLMKAQKKKKENPLNGTNPTLPTKTIQRLRKNLIIQQPEKIPLRARLSLEIPKHPPFGLLLEDANLRRNVELCIGLHLLAPRFDEVDAIAGADAGAVGVVSGVSGANVPAVETGGAVGHCGGPFADDGPVVCAAGVGWGVGADVFSMILIQVSKV